jgi:DNA repair and recombination protein RAD54 and RAD54-like protein
MEYEVLYYKRTNKIHQSKGVAKSDGILTVFPANDPSRPHGAGGSGTVTLRDASAEFASADQDGNASDSDSSDESNTNSSQRKKKAVVSGSNRHHVLFSGAHKEMAKRGALREDEVVALGAYQVQILAIRKVGPCASHANRVESLKRVVETTGMGSHSEVLKSGSGLVQRPAIRTTFPTLPLKRKFAPLSSSLSSASSPKKISSTVETVLHSTSIHPKKLASAPVMRPPVRLMPRRPLTSKCSVGPSHKAATYGPTGLVMLTNKRPFLPSKTNVSPRPYQKPSPFESSKANSSVVTSSSSPSPSSSLMTVPEISLPATMRQALRPHQVTGVAFLWKALHDTSRRGAILADEMGLGKTLITIAIICGMHRRQRDKVRLRRRDLCGCFFGKEEKSLMSL